MIFIINTLPHIKKQITSFIVKSEVDLLHLQYLLEGLDQSGRSKNC